VISNSLIKHRQPPQLQVIREMDDKPESKKDPSRKKVYLKPELKQIPLDDQEGLVEFCRGKPYDAQELKELTKGMLRPKKGRRQDE
jgi:hypothetical protein